MSETKHKKHRGGKHFRLRRVLVLACIVLLALLALLTAVGGILFIRYYSLLNVTSNQPGDNSIYYDESALVSTPATASPDDPDNPYRNPSVSPETASPSETTASPAESAGVDTASPDITQQSGTTSDPAALVKQKGIINILLIGADYETRYGNSDAMVVVSINKADKRITLTSIMRDTEAYFPGVQNGTTVIWRDKISNAHAYGGPKLLINAIESNFGITIDNYAEVHYEEFIRVFDAIGGIDVTMTAEEVAAFNIESSQKIPEDSAGRKVHLNAEMALAYTRMRHLSGNDFGRTQRHRTILIAAFEKVKTLGITELDRLLTTLLPIIETDLSMTDCLSYAASAASYATYNVETFRIPLDGKYIYENNNLCIRGDNKTATIAAWCEQVAGNR